ncbi:MAG: choice-of-anchor Q domain-containing protein, partial [Planctomycetota bacterium]
MGRATLRSGLVAAAATALSIILLGCGDDDGGGGGPGVPAVVPRALDLTSPAGGEVLVLGDALSIAWSAAGVQSLRIEISRDDGLTWAEIAASVDAAAGPYLWPAEDGGHPLPQLACRVRISCAEHGDARDVSDGVFSIWSGDVLRVSKSAPPGGDGLTWATAFQHPQDAVDAAPSGAEVWVAAETYAVRTPGDASVLVMKDGVAAYGGFAGDEANREDRAPETNIVILDGEGVAFHVVTGASQALLYGLTVTGGNASGIDPADQDGGGLLAADVEGLAVRDCVFTANSCADDGAGVCVGLAGEVSFRGCRFETNDAAGGGGGIFSYAERLELTDCEFLTNSASYGAGVYFSNSPRDVDLTRCLLQGNTATGRGGGLHCYGPERLDVSDCVFTANVSGDEGGGCYVSSGDAVSFNGTTFEGNSAEDGGGAFLRSGAPEFDRCRFIQNTATLDGGGIGHNSCNTLALRNCVFDRNGAADQGGAGYGYGGDGSFTNCTFSGNTSAEAGGLYNYYGDLTVVNSILWGNAGAEIVDYGASALSVVNRSCVEGGYAGDGNTGADPLFADAAAGDLRISAGSPCIDSADGAAAPDLDIDGVPRADDPSTPNSGTAVPDFADMGAFEFLAAGAEAIRVISPNGGENWAVGSTRQISWASAGVATVMIELSRNGGASWEPVAGPLDAAAGVCAWQVTGGGPALPQRHCLIRVRSAVGSAEDSSDGEFAVSDGVWRVRSSAPAGGDGLTWATAFQHPQDAVDAAGTGNDIWVALGTYGPRVAGDESVVAMEDGVSLFGGFAGTESAPSQRDPAANATELDGTGSVPHVVVGASDATIDGFRITGGDAVGGAPSLMDGGGLYCFRKETLLVANCDFAGNAALFSGGGIVVEEGSAAVVGCRFTGNSCGAIGGAAYLTDSTVFISECEFVGNSSSGSAGALACYPGWCEITNCVFTGNAARTGGAAQVAGAGPGTVTNCTFTDNSAITAGALAVSGEAIVVTNCIMWGDSAVSYPEVYANPAAPPLVTYSCVAGGHEGVGNVAGDPKFVDAGAGDLRLSAGSPCIDSADGDAAPELDFDGLPRHDDAGLDNVGAGVPASADIGAFEFQGDTTGSWLEVLSPAGPAAWRVGETVEIHWIATPDVAAVTVELSRDGGNAWEAIASPAPGDRSCSWAVTDGGGPLPQAGCILRVADAADGSPSATVGGIIAFDGIWHVDLDAAVGGDGLAWATAFRHPQDALDLSSPGDEIWVAEGTYIRRSSGDASVLTMSRNVPLYGGFDGTESARGARDWAANLTALDGEGAVRVAVAAFDATLDGFTVTGGYAGGTDSNTGSGAGLYAPGVMGLVTANCVFAGNTAELSGGALFASAGSATVTDCEFEANTAVGGTGGGVASSGCLASVTGCTFTDNSAREGGGVASYYSNITVDGCTFSANAASYDGGGMHLVQRSYTGELAGQVRRCVYQDNSAGGMGGGACIEGPRWFYEWDEIIVSNCVFTGNQADAGGGLAGDAALTLL